MHVFGLFADPGEVGGLVDALGNSGINRRDMIISTYDEEKFSRMDEITQATVSNIMSDEEDLGELRTFAEGVKEFEDKDSQKTYGIVVCVKCAKHKAQEVKSVMEQSGALQIKMDT
jgi:hypothetical protein